jgi:hypothetical protein
MGKLFNELQHQLKLEEYKKDAEDCIKIYNKLKEQQDGHLWESTWNPLVSTSFIGKYPNSKRISKPTYLGRLVLADIESKTK